MLKAWTRVSTCIAICLVPLACGRANYEGRARDAGEDANPPMGLDAPDMDTGERDAGLRDAAADDAAADDAAEGDAGADAGRMCPPTGCVDLDPGSNGCAVADEGPFVEVGRFDTPGAAYGMWTHASYVLVADTTGGFSTFAFNGTTFTPIANVATGWTEAIWNRGNDIFVSAPGTGWSVFGLSATGVPIPVVDERVMATESRRGWSDEARVYIPNGAGGLLAYDFRGAALTPVATLASMGFSQGVWSDGLNLYFADGSRLRVVRLDGENFIDLASVALPGSSRVWGVGGVIYAAHATGVVAYTFDGAALLRRASFTTPTSVRDVWSDGVHVFLAAEGSGVYALRLEGPELVEVGRVDTDGQALGVVGDGTYLYVGDQTTGIKAYAGFRCTRPRTF